MGAAIASAERPSTLQIAALWAIQASGGSVQSAIAPIGAVERV
jgi:hypothetical protein